MGLEKATFAGGCFWCTEAAFQELEGVIEAVNGYTGGETENPTYEQVCTGKTGHYEATQVTYDPDKISYEKLLEVFWRSIDPTDGGGQFVDRGSQYRTAIFYHDGKQKELAERSKKELAESRGVTVATEILPARTFYKAEEYHQDYYKKKRLEYELYKRGSGR